MEKKIENAVVEESKVDVKEIKSENKLFLEREAFKGNDGKEYYNYIVNGKLRLKDIKIRFAPKDNGGYTLLDIMFGVTNKAELKFFEETMVDGTTGQRTKYMRYEAHVSDTQGDLVCGLKPSRDSDKWLLQCFVNQMGSVK